MDTTADAPSTIDPGPMNLLPCPPLSPARKDNTDALPAVDPGSMNLLPPPPSSPAREDDVDHPITENTSDRASEPPLQTPPSPHDDPGRNPPACSPGESSISSHSSTLTPGILPALPLLGHAGNLAFDLTGVRGNFISEDTCTYWGSVPGGTEWVTLVRSYLELEAIPPTKGVSLVLSNAPL